jgi:hypothetical protein
MGIFDFFKSKKESVGLDNLNLETLLQKAAVAPENRSTFYKRILTDKLVVLTQESGFQGERVLEKDTQVQIVTYPDGKIPAFTSKERIFDKGIVKEEVAFLEIKGEDLLTLLKDTTIVLNPYSDYGKELLPNEIKSILNGSILTDSHKKITIEKETTIQIGQPANYPTEITTALSNLFANYPNVKSAFVGWIYNPNSGEPPHYIFGIDGEGDLQEITNEAGFTAKQFLKPDEIVDFTRIDKNGGVSDYFLKSTTPFYKR